MKKAISLTDVGGLRNELSKYRKGKKLDIRLLNQVARLAWGAGSCPVRSIPGMRIARDGCLVCSRSTAWRPVHRSSTRSAAVISTMKNSSGAMSAWLMPDPLHAGLCNAAEGGVS